jgi:hypothetical protein
MTGNETLSNHHLLPTPELASGRILPKCVAFPPQPVTGQPQHRIVQARP